VARPKEFDVDRALGDAQALFRERGYEAVSLGELCGRMRIARQSLYDTYGDKHSLFMAALERYRDDALDAVAAAFDGAITGRDAIELFLATATGAPRSERACGCMILNAVGEMAPGDVDVVHLAKVQQRTVLRALADRVRMGGIDGSLRSDLDPVETARWIVATYYGVRAMAKIEPTAPLHHITSPVLAAIGT
jgi:TetR/AcrR family transcriptional regulator, transcriptional repressor for nem operon